jgi:hypothetical protein
MPDLARLGLCRPDLASRALLAKRASRPVQGLENPFPTSTEKSKNIEYMIWITTIHGTLPKIPGKFGLSLLESGSENSDTFLQLLLNPLTGILYEGGLAGTIALIFIQHTTVTKITSRTDYS